MSYIIREMRKEEVSLLDDFLYEAIFIPVWYSFDEKDASIVKRKGL
ncbi:hypothetical protein [Hespellia stercorisuis]|nr:hypothetical protein [Hespellia stercorisuis]